MNIKQQNIKESTLERLRHLLTVEYEHLRISELITMHLEMWDGRIINKRVEKPLQEIVGDKYRVTYYFDNLYWKNLDVHHISNKDFRWNYQLHYSKDGPLFKCDIFSERQPNSYIMSKILMFEECLKNPDRLDFLIEGIYEFSDKCKQFDTFLKDFHSYILHCLPNDVFEFCNAYRGTL